MAKKGIQKRGCNGATSRDVSPLLDVRTFKCI